MPQQPGQKPLNLVRSVPRNGAIRVSPDLKTILLVFDKNVVNDSVWANNRRQIKLWRGSNRIGINVVRIKDTVNFAKRQNIYVKQIKPLRSLSNYRLVVDPDLTAKNGQTLGKTVTIRFKTGRRIEPEE
ncbi:MAG: hypothetical protein H6Q64_1883 [Firmicutes bacterium]|nr:hypothetical protein [Bacillota bacterium]